MQPDLKRSLGLPLLVLYGVGTMVGGGFYALLGAVAHEAGVATPGAFLFAGLLALPSALSFAELSARIPESAGEARYVEAAFGSRRLGVVVGLLVALTGVVSAATLSRAIGGFLEVAVGAPLVLAALSALAVLTGLAAWGVAKSTLAAAVITVVEVLGLVLAAIYAPTDFGTVLDGTKAFFVPSLDTTMIGLMAGGLLAFYAFVGFEDLVNMAEEVRNPVRNLPRAILGSLAITMVLYVVVAAVAVTAVTPEELATSSSPLATMVGDNRVGTTLTWIAILAGVNGVLVQLVMTARVLFGLARGGSLPAAFARVNERTRTPLLATAVAGGLAGCLTLGLPLGTLAKIASGVLLGVFVIVNASLVRLHRKEPAPPGVLRVHPLVPIAGMLGSAIALVAHLLSF
ncbi:MAG: APA family basic amino acid/polyamine antiporter [Planctomycetota bacterium]